MSALAAALAKAKEPSMTYKELDALYQDALWREAQAKQWKERALVILTRICPELSPTSLAEVTRLIGDAP